MLVVPPFDAEPFPSLGGQVCRFIEERAVYGPGSLKGRPAQLNSDQKLILWRAYEVFPKGHPRAGRRRFDRAGVSVRKGSAKCLSPDVELTLEDGSRRRADALRPGDMVLSHRDGKSLFRRVIAVEVQPSSAMYRVQTSSGRDIEVSAGHPFLVSGTQWRPGMPKRWKYSSCDPASGDTAWSDVQDLAAGDRVVVGLDWLSDGGDADLGWLLGVLVGDGCGDGRFSNSDAEIAKKVSETFDMTELTHRQDGQYFLRGSAAFRRQHDLYGKNAYTKTTPTAVMTGKRDTILGYLAGLLDTDGSTILRRQSGKWTRLVEWYSVSRQLMTDVQHLLAAVGVNAILRARHSKYLGADYVSWSVTVSDHAQVCELASILPVVRHQNVENMALFRETFTERGKFADVKLDRVVSVDRISDGVTIAVEVDDTHVHVTNGLVTHNTEFAAWVAFAELHPDAPVRFAGFTKTGELLQGRPVADPYIPLLANTQEQVAELAYGALMVVCEEGADPELFDVGLDRIIRLGADGRADGKAVPIAGAPNARDGARTTFQCFDETHRLHLPSHKAAVQTMNANLPKRPEEDPWTLSTTTAGEPGQDSVAEDEFFEAESISRGELKHPTLFFFHRQASDGYDLTDFDQRVDAVREASGPDVAEWSDLHRIAAQWDRPKVDKTYLERVWLNRWTAQESQAFNVKTWRALALAGECIAPRSRVTIGFDGARMRDATALVVTDIKTGFQELGGLWERPLDAPLDWEVDESEVSERLADLFKRFRVQKMYCDPPHWNSTVGEWSVKYPDVVQEWWTARRRPMVNAILGYKDAMEAGKISHSGDPDLERHIGNAGRVQLNLTDEEGERLWILGKLHPDRKFDACMAAILSWQARMDELGKVPARRKRQQIMRVR